MAELAAAAEDGTAAERFFAARKKDPSVLGRGRFGSAAAEQTAAEHPTVVDRTAAEIEPAVYTAVVEVEPAVCMTAEDCRVAEDMAAEAADYSSGKDSCRSLPSLLLYLHPFCLFLKLFYRVPQKRVRDPYRFLSKILSCCLPLFSPLLYFYIIIS